jgi:hypothetical protein
MRANGAQLPNAPIEMVWLLGPPAELSPTSSATTVFSPVPVCRRLTVHYRRRDADSSPILNLDPKNNNFCLVSPISRPDRRRAPPPYAWRRYVGALLPPSSHFRTNESVGVSYQNWITSLATSLLQFKRNKYSRSIHSPPILPCPAAAPPRPCPQNPNSP